MDRQKIMFDAAWAVVKVAASANDFDYDNLEVLIREEFKRHPQLERAKEVTLKKRGREIGEVYLANFDGPEDEEDESAEDDPVNYNMITYPQWLAQSGQRASRHARDAWEANVDPTDYADKPGDEVEREAEERFNRHIRETNEGFSGSRLNGLAGLQRFFGFKG